MSVFTLRYLLFVANLSKFYDLSNLDKPQHDKSSFIYNDNYHQNAVNNPIERASSNIKSIGSK